MAKPRQVKVKRKCCKSNPRCKRCPVVLQRLEQAGFAERHGKRTYELAPKIKKKTLKRVRKRALA
jgi:hypothetical protein